jgi:signal transduction histidine kinase
MSPRGTATPLFEDAYTDARMRGLIPHFAKLAVLLTLVTAPLVAPSGLRLLAMMANCLVALVLTIAFHRSGYLGRASHGAIQALLLVFVVQIALGGALAGSVLAYGLLQVLPVIFSSIFFTGTRRYATAVVAGAVELGVGQANGTVTLEVGATRTLVYLLVAAFGAHVAATLRDALRANQALHSVLEVASGDPLAPELAEIGLAAALDVVGWDAGAVALESDGRLDLVALRGFAPAVEEFYRRNPIRVGDGSMTAQVFATGLPHNTVDLAAFLGGEHPLVQDGVESNAGVPIRYHGAAIGVLLVDHRTRRLPNDREIEQLSQVAEQLGLAIGNAQAHRREAAVAAELRELGRRKDEFLATISHELRTPATTINLAARTLSHLGGRLSDTQRDDAHETLVRRSAQLCELVDSLLEQAVADAGELQLTIGWLDWSTALPRWAADVADGTGRQIVVDVPAEPVTGMVDATKMERVVANLVGNALKFSAADTVVHCRLSASADVVTVEVEDAGVGIASVHLDHVFDRFFQCDSSATRVRGGFGIGLSLVRHFVAAHGGEVFVRSTPGVGSVFTIRVPRHARVLDPVRAPDPAESIAGP